MNITRTIGLLVAALAALLVAACSNAPATGGAGSTPHNDADTAFVQGMIPHHSQAVAMAQLAPDRAASSEVKDLAVRIAQAQGPEIEQMRGFLTTWGVPENGSGTGHGAMSGMMTDTQMGQLGQATGVAFDRMFLQMMTAHHSGAVQRAETELRDGQSTDAKALAQRIIDAQRAEITQMQQLLSTL